MRPQFGIEKNIETVDFKANISILVTPGVSGSYVGLMSYASFDDHIFYSIQDLIVIDTVILHPT